MFIERYNDVSEKLNIKINKKVKALLFEYHLK